MIKVFLVIVVGILAILVVRMMFSAKLEEEKQPADSKKHGKRKKRKNRSTEKTVENSKSKSDWKKPALEQWQPGQPVEGCPNLRNEFHQCSAYCWQRYSQRPPDMVAMDK